jgi:hypothetical protein
LPSKVRLCTSSPFTLNASSCVGGLKGENDAFS